jgi:hypothetical protein
MPEPALPTSLLPDRLMAHMHVLCKDIGPRPPASEQERRAAAYVKKTLQHLGLTDIVEQPFRTHHTLGQASIPFCVATALAFPLGWLLGVPGKWLGSALAALSLREALRFLAGRPASFESFIAHDQSQNVIVRIPPAGPVKRQLYLIGHLDTQKNRMLTPPPNPALMKPGTFGALGMPLVAALGLLADALRKKRGAPAWQIALEALMLATIGGLLAEEANGHIEGANDNATAVSVLLSVAEALRAHPLQNTEVVLLFTGCEELMCVGMEKYLRQFQPPQANTYWLDLEMVGTGHLCYVTKHGVSPVAEYAPAPEMVRLAEATAREHPELQVTGKEMLIVEEVANLRHYGYRALCLAGYNDQGFLPNWHRYSDNLEHIEPQTLSRAAQYTWEFMRTLDSL